MSFRTTRWSLVLRASRADTEGLRALDELCAAYWPPVYALYRGEGLDPEAAGDLTQGLFADLLARGDLAKADRERGRFRAFLRTCARHFLANERDRARARKRGAGRLPLSLDVEGEEGRLRREPMDRLDPAALFERRWAQAVIEAALGRLRRDEAAAGRGELFETLRPALEGTPPARGWAALAEEIGTSEGALRVAAHRLRARFRERLLTEVRDTIDDPATAGSELEELLAALRA